MGVTPDSGFVEVSAPPAEDGGFLEDDFLADVKATAKHPGGTCGMARILASLEGDPLRWKVQQALDDPGYTGIGIATVLTNRGYPVSDYTVQRHRNNKCGCARWPT